MCSRCYVNYYSLWSVFLCYISSMQWSKEEDRRSRRRRRKRMRTLYQTAHPFSPPPVCLLFQCAPFFILSSTRWHTPSLHFSTRWKTSPCGAHFSLTHSSAHHLKCVGTLKWLWWLSALLEHHTWSSPYILWLWWLSALLEHQTWSSPYILWLWWLSALLEHHTWS